LGDLSSICCMYIMLTFMIDTRSRLAQQHTCSSC
jgi:hypothetical protein